MTMNDEEAARFYGNPDNLRPGARVTPATGLKMTGHIPVRFPASTVDRIKELATEDGVSVSVWIRRAVDKAISVRTNQVTQSSTGSRFSLDSLEPVPVTATAVLEWAH